jgi:hypothetical protein
MKILYVGTLDPFGTCYSRFCSLKKLEPDIHGFDTDVHLGWRSIGRIHRTIENHILTGPCITRANRELITACQDLTPDVVWIDSGVWVHRSTLRRLKEQGCFLVSHITDALRPRSASVKFKRRRLRQMAPLYDAFLTTNVDDYRALAESQPSSALLTDLGYCSRRFEPSPLSEEDATRWDNPLVFIGHHEPSTEAGILALIDAGLPVTVYGHPAWFSSPNRNKLGDRLKPQLGNEDYIHALKGARIGLCFVSVLNYNQTASRSFEIPATGTFLLAIRTPQHLECYREGQEAEFFDSHDELVRKASYYLEHSVERDAIARRGHQRCVESGYSWDGLMAKDWPRIKEIYARRSRPRES